MGCQSSTIKSSTPQPPATDFSVLTQQVKQTWPVVQKTDKLGEKVFAHLLYKYPELRTFYHVPETCKSEADLLNAGEVKEEGDKFILFCSDIIENSDTKYKEILHEKATELYKQGVNASQVKYFGESLFHIIKNEANELTLHAKQSWQIFTNQVFHDIAKELAKFRRKSIVSNM